MTAEHAAVLILDTDYAESPLWHDGLLHRDDLPLTEELWIKLQDWANYYNAHHNSSGDWTPGSDRLRYYEQGDHLAGDIAAELGNDFTVKHLDRTFSSTKPATNVSAAAALHAMVQADARMAQSVGDDRQRGARFRWR